MFDVMMFCLDLIWRALRVVGLVLSVTSVLSLPIVIPIVDDWFHPAPEADAGGDET